MGVREEGERVVGEREEREDRSRMTIGKRNHFQQGAIARTHTAGQLNH